VRGTVELYGKGWRYRLDVGRDAATGRRRIAMKGRFSTEREARRPVNRVLVAVEDGARPRQPATGG
jgi:hypothetical protein